MARWRAFQKLSQVPKQRFSDEVILFSDADGAFKAVDEDGVVSALAGAGALPNPTDEGDVLTVVDGSWGGAPGGDSQPGAVRRLTVDVTAADLAEGPITLYTPDTDEVVGPVYLQDVVFCNASSGITIGRDEQVAGDNDFPALAGWDSDLSRDGVGLAFTADGLGQVPLTTGPVTAGFTTDGSLTELHAPAWEATTVYAQFDHIIAAGHIWECDPGGTSGGSEPDFAGNIGGTVADGVDIVWTDFGDCTAGSATVAFDVCIPDAP